MKVPRTIGQRLRGEADPIGARLLRVALDHQDDLLAALDDARRQLGRDPAALGLVLFGRGIGGLMPAGSVVVHERAHLWVICRRMGLDIPTGISGFFPVLTLDSSQACVCWLGPVSGLGGYAA